MIVPSVLLKGFETHKFKLTGSLHADNFLKISYL